MSPLLAVSVVAVTATLTLGGVLAWVLWMVDRRESERWRDVTGEVRALRKEVPR